MSGVRAWLGNWRNLFGIAAIVLVGTMTWQVISAEQSRSKLQQELTIQVKSNHALDERGLTVIVGLESQANANSGRITELLTEVQALDAQLVSLGAKPVVVVSVSPGDTVTTSKPKSVTATKPKAAPKPKPAPTKLASHPAPATTTTTTPTQPCAGINLLGDCLGQAGAGPSTVHGTQTGRGATGRTDRPGEVRQTQGGSG